MFAAVKTDAFMKAFWWRAGKCMKNENMELHGRYECDKSKNHCLSYRGSVSHKSVDLAAAIIFSVTDSAFRKYDANLTYSVNDKCRLGLKHCSPSK